MESRRKVALITGANRGVGKGIALAFAEKGYDLFLAHYGEPEKAQEVIEEIQKRFGREVHTYDCNLAVAAEVEDLFRAAVDAYGEIDVLMSNAGVGLEKYLTYTTIREMDNIYQTNYRAGIYLATMVANHMKEKKIRGSILFTASTRGSFEVHPDDVLYGGMKAALHRSAQSLAREFAPYGIRVNTISPGCIDVNPQGHRDGSYDQQMQEIPLGRIGRGEDIGYAAVFLSSEEASFITGINLYVDGGINCGRNIGLDNPYNPAGIKGSGVGVLD